MKYIKTYEARKENLSEYTYDEVLALSGKEAPIKEYLVLQYPNEFREMLWKKFGRSFSLTQIKNILKFAKKHKDQALIKLVEDYLNFMEEIKLKREAEKYNL